MTSDQEHPGLVGPLLAARQRGVSVRAVPFARVAEAVGPDTTLVALSHVSWVGGEHAPAGLADLDVPVILDGAQGAGAVHVDPRALGCVAYAAAGQKWLCGADGTGFLWVDPAFAGKVALLAPGYVNFEDARPASRAGSRTRPRASTRRRCRARASRSRSRRSRRSRRSGGTSCTSGPSPRPRRLADALRERGRAVMPRSATTLVAWEDPFAEQTRDRLAAAGVVVRDLPGRVAGARVRRGLERRRRPRSAAFRNLVACFPDPDSLRVARTDIPEGGVMRRSAALALVAASALAIPATANAATKTINAGPFAKGKQFQDAFGDANQYFRKTVTIRKEAASPWPGLQHRPSRDPSNPPEKYLRAIDIETGRIVWEVPQVGAPEGNYSGVLSTAGGLVFYGETGGSFAAVDAKSGKTLWHFDTGQEWRASPMTYLVNGRQHVAIASGGNIISFALPESLRP